MKYPLAGDLQATTVSQVVANPRANSAPERSGRRDPVTGKITETRHEASHREYHALGLPCALCGEKPPGTSRGAPARGTPRDNASGRFELHAEGGLEAIFADRDQAEFEADELRRRGVDGVEVKVRPPARHPMLQKQNPTQMSRDEAWLAFRRIIREPGVGSMEIARDLALEYRWTLVDLSEQGKGHGIFVLSPAEVGAKLCQIEWEVEQVHDAFAARGGIRYGTPAGWGAGFKFVWLDNDEVLFLPSSTRYYKTQDAAERAAAADAWAMAKQMKVLMSDVDAGGKIYEYTIPEVRNYLLAVLNRTFEDTEPPELYEMRATADTGEAPKKKRTYLEARDDIWAALKRAGWSMSSPGLKTPHATSPGGYLRLWFKPQAVHYTINSSEHAPGVFHASRETRSISHDLDIRTMAPSEFLDFIKDRFPKAFA